VLGRNGWPEWWWRGFKLRRLFVPASPTSPPPPHFARSCSCSCSPCVQARLPNTCARSSHSARRPRPAAGGQSDDGAGAGWLGPRPRAMSTQEADCTGLHPRCHSIPHRTARCSRIGRDLRRRLSQSQEAGVSARSSHAAASTATRPASTSTCGMAEVCSVGSEQQRTAANSSAQRCAYKTLYLQQPLPLPGTLQRNHMPPSGQVARAPAASPPAPAPAQLPRWLTSAQHPRAYRWVRRA
jgi:hypothetical protein